MTRLLDALDRSDVLVLSNGMEVGGTSCAVSEGDARRARAARILFFIAPTVADRWLMSKQKGATS